MENNKSLAERLVPLMDKYHLIQLELEQIRLQIKDAIANYEPQSIYDIYAKKDALETAIKWDDPIRSYDSLQIKDYLNDEAGKYQKPNPLAWGTIDKDKPKDIDLDPFKNTRKIIKIAKALVLYAKCKHRGKIALAEKIASKYGIDEKNYLSMQRSSVDILTKSFNELYEDPFSRNQENG